MSRTQQQSGAVSLFMVILAMLLMSVVTISFLRIMTNDQMRASNNDLAQSAYDSAEAGVEDAKRALVWYTNCVNGGGSCATEEESITSTECNTAIRVANGWTGDTGEIKVQQSTQIDTSTGESIDQALDQAYTCVTLELDTDDYLANIGADQSVLVPLVATGTFNRVTIDWYSEDDLSEPGANAAPDTSTSTPKRLFTKDTWPVNRPSVLRAQLMQVDDTFRLDDFDYTTNNGRSNTNTVFLYPSTTGASSAVYTQRDVRASSSGNVIPADADSAPLPARCVTDIPSGGYACSITMTLPNPIDAGDRNNTTAFLRLTSYYVGSHVRITMDGTQFNDVQPIVDSTGRANDLFRRVQSRIDLYDTSTFPYPDAAVDVNNSFCKDFGVTDTRYLNRQTCAAYWDSLY